MTGKQKLARSALQLLDRGLPIMTIAFGISFYVSSAQVGLRLDDEGYILELATRVQRGEAPYLDFFTLYPPTIYYLLAGFLKLFGPNLLLARYLMVAVKSANLVLGYLLSRRLVPRFAAAFTPLLILFIEILSGFNLNPHSAWFAGTLFLLVWLALGKWLDNGRAMYCFLAGICCSLAFAFKQPQGAVVTLACFAWLWTAQKTPPNPTRSHRSQMAWDLSIFIVIGGFFGVAMLGGDSAYRFLFLLPAVLGLLTLWKTRKAVRKEPGLVWLILGGFAATLLWFGYFTNRLGLSPFIKGIVLEPLRQGHDRFIPKEAALMAAGTEVLIASYLIIIIVSSLLLIRSSVVRGSNNRTMNSTKHSFVQFGIVMASFLCFALYPWPLGARAVWISVPFAVLAVWIGWSFVDGLFSLRLPRRITVLAVIVLCSGLLALGIISHERLLGWTNRTVSTLSQAFAVHLDPSSLEKSPLPNAPILIPKSDTETRVIVDLVGWIEAHIREDEPILVFPGGGHLHFLSNRRNPSFVGGYGVRSIPNKSAVEELITDLDETGAAWLVLVSGEPGIRMGGTGDTVLLAQELGLPEPTASFGPFDVFRIKPQD